MIDLACEEEFKRYFGFSLSMRDILEDADNICDYQIWMNAWNAGQSILRKELEELRKDKARLDFLEYTNRHIGIGMRAAIDAAMEIE